MEIPNKRIRLMVQTDPSIPLDDGTSPFLEASNDMIDLIFRTLSNGQKNKMRMELVCGKFQSRIRERSAWKGQHILEIGGDVYINGYKFSFLKAASALATLLDRITVHKFILNDFSEISSIDILLALCHTITQHKDFVTLKFIHLNGASDYSPIISALIGCGLEKVLQIECGDWNNSKSIQYIPTSFYCMLPHCRNMQFFNLIINSVWPILDLLKPALADCNKITQINIDSEEDAIPHPNAMELAQFCSMNFPKLTTFLFWPTIDAFEPIEFTNALGEQICSNMTLFGITMNAEIASHRQFLITFCNSFPKLRKLNISCIGSFLTETILQAVGNIFATYAHPGSQVYKFEFIVRAKNRGNVLFELSQKKWNENDEFVKMESTNGIWKCTKGNVQITLDMF